MKHKKDFLTIEFNRFIKEKNFSLQGISLEMLLYLIEQFSGVLCVVTSKDVVEDVCVVNQDHIGENFFSFVSPFKKRVVGFQAL